MNDQEVIHPSREQLCAYGLGKLGRQGSKSVEEHVADCNVCCQTLLDLADDSFVDLVQHSTAAGEAPETLRDHPRYRLLERLGAGGMGVVYKAEHRVMQRVVALKVIHNHILGNAEARERFQSEVRNAARLNHSNIVTALDAESVGEQLFLVMELVEGTTLRNLVQERGPLPVAEACHYVCQAALGLQHAFEHGLVHRDIKPNNLIVTSNGQVKILDFGLARLVSENRGVESLTPTGVIVGTPDYLAPEQACEPHLADIRADIYSLGCTLYYLLTGQPPFPGGTPLQKLLGHAQKPPRRLREIRPEVPTQLETAVARMMAKDAEKRYAIPGEVACVLTPFIDRPDCGVEAPRAGTWRVLVALGMFFLVGGLFGAYVLHVTTDKGTVVLEAADDVEVTVQQAGRQIHILDTRSKQKVVLESGVYQAKLSAGKEGLKLSTDTFTLMRGKEVVVRVWREPRIPSTSTPTPAIPLPARSLQPFRHTGPVTSVAVSKDGRLALSGGTDGTRLWDLDLHQERWLFPTTTNSVALSPDGQLALTGGETKHLRLLDTATGKVVRTFTGHQDRVAAVAFSPDGRHIVSGSWDKTVRVWDAETGREIHRVEGHQERVDGVTFAADRLHFLSCSFDGTIRRWRTDRKEEVSRLVAGGPVDCLALSRDSRRVFGCTEGRVLLWNLEDGEFVQSWKVSTRQIHTLALSPDERHLLVGVDERSVVLLDAATGRVVQRFDGHKKEVTDAVFTPDGRRILSGSSDGTVRLWQVGADVR